MIPLLINQSKISLDFSWQLQKHLVDSDLAVIGLTGIGPIQKISISGVLSYWLNDFFLYCIDRFDHIKANKSKLINKMFDQRTLLGTSANQKRHYWKSYNNYMIVTYVQLIIVIYRLPKRTVVLTETVIMPEPQARLLSVLKSILLSQGQFIYHDNAIYISNYYFYFIEGYKDFLNIFCSFQYNVGLH